tara:strand:- start:1065 stop:1337 length:273 start_codon:yes stop_codon:yes gene_type:complete
MTKLRVKKRSQLLYPDGSVRGQAGYVVDTSAACDRNIVAEQGDALEVLRERSAVASSVDASKFVVAAPKPEKAEKKTAKKKASKKKAAKK